MYLQLKRLHRFYSTRDEIQRVIGQLDVTFRLSRYCHRFSPEFTTTLAHRAANQYALELPSELVPRLFSPSYFRGAVSPGVKSVVPFAGYIEILRESRRIKPRLSRDDPAKWSHSGHESISYWKKRYRHKPNFLPRFILLFRNVEVRSASCCDVCRKVERGK